MQITMCKSKIHRATVTDACLNYSGSITIGKNMMEAAGLRKYEIVHVNNMSNAAHWETYVIEGDDGEICLNGCPARLFQPGDEVIILSLAMMSPFDADHHELTTVLVDKQNNVLSVG
jgi:aspartate 1-decarboxylase